MDVWCVVCVLALASGPLAASVSITGDVQLDEHVRRITRSGEISGYDFAHLYSEEEQRHLTERDVTAHAEHPSQDERPLSLHLNSGDKLRMSLRKRSVVDPDTVVVELQGTKETARRLGERDCYFSGPTEGSDGHASLSMCGGRLMGYVGTEKRHYEVHPLPETATNRRSADPLRVLVTWTDVSDEFKRSAYDSGLHTDEDDTADHDDDDDDGFDEIDTDDDEEDDGDDVTEFNDLDDEYVNKPDAEHLHNGTDSDEDKDLNDADEDGEYLKDDVLEFEEEVEEYDEIDKNETDTQERRAIWKRSLKDRKVVVETANILDSWYIKNVKESMGLTTTDELIDLQIVKWNGVQAILGDIDQVKWDIKVKLVQIKIWRTNPGWYKTSRANKIGIRMKKVCAGSKGLKADQITLSTSFTSDRGRIGVSFIGAVCSSKRCSAVITSGYKYFTELHEFGHSLGLNHDGVSSMRCPNGKKNGFMGGNRFFFRTDCYTGKLGWYFKKRGCLFRTNANSAQYSLKPLMPGQTIGVEDQCPVRYGPGYEYYSFGDGDKMCTNFGCMMTNTNSPHYGTVKAKNALDGTPCGKDKICRSKSCESLSSSDISIDEKQVKPLLRDGGWGGFGGWSGCSSSCGTGIKTSQRSCNNPRPQYGAYCQGEAYKAEVCPGTQRPCAGESKAEGTLIAQRAKKICQTLKRNSATNDGYTGEARVAGIAGVTEKCRVYCKRDGRKWSRDTFLLPDGTPCTGSDTNLRNDMSKGISWHCVKGRCMAFGCDGKTMGAGGGQKKDRCGVCGGNGNSCVMTLGRRSSQP